MLEHLDKEHLFELHTNNLPNYKKKCQGMPGIFIVNI